MSIQFLFFEGCPSHDDALHRLKTVMAEEGIHADIDIINVETEEQALALHFAGSPTILIGGEDVAPVPPDAPYQLSCRIYHLENGRVSPLPSPHMIRHALRNHLASL